MRQASVRLAVIAIGGLALASCGRKEAPVPRPAPPVVVPPKEVAASTEDYFKLESSHALLVVRASEMAMQRSAHGRTQAIASRLKANHAGIAAQLNMAGRRLNLLPPASLLMLDQVLFDGLTRASDFDTAYLRTMKSVVEACVRSNTAYADNGASPTLRPVARFTASTCREELRSL